MAAMTDAEILASVKKLLMITGNFHDDTLSLYIAEVKDFMKNAGVADDIITDSASVGCIMRGVSDLWGNGNGTELSSYFKQRVIQLSLLHPQEESGE